MEKEDLEYFIGQDVKLVLENNFRLYGTIEKISDDSIIFKSRDRTSLIRFSIIKEIVGW